MGYHTAYERLSSALWQFYKTHNDAYVRLMLAVRDIEDKQGKPPKPPIQWTPSDEADK